MVASKSAGVMRGAVRPLVLISASTFDSSIAQSPFCGGLRARAPIDARAAKIGRVKGPAVAEIVDPVIGRGVLAAPLADHHLLPRELARGHRVAERWGKERQGHLIFALEVLHLAGVSLPVSKLYHLPCQAQHPLGVEF